MLVVKISHKKFNKLKVCFFSRPTNLAHYISAEAARNPEISIIQVKRKLFFTIYNNRCIIIYNVRYNIRLISCLISALLLDVISDVLSDVISDLISD